jgi:iron complex transport system substrate-binding protein
VSLAVSREAFLLAILLAFSREGRLRCGSYRRSLGILVAGGLFLGAPHLAAAERQPAKQTAAGPASAARAVTDEVGRRVQIPADVKRIVSLAPNLTEIVYALGIEDRLVGDTNYCDTPPAAKQKPHVGNPVNPSLEAIVALHPDLVLATTSINRPETAEALQHAGIAVYTSDVHTVRGMLDSIGRMAELIDAKKQGDELVARLQKRLDAVQARVADKPLAHVLFVVQEQPLITIGQNTFIADALRWAGAESVITSDHNWPQISVEEVVRLQPDYIVFTSAYGDSSAQELAELQKLPGWQGLDAVEVGHVVDMGEEVARPSPGLVDAIEQLARELHPDAFAVNHKTWPPIDTIRFASSSIHAARQEAGPCAR